MVVGNAQISIWYRAWRTETMDCMLVPFFFLPQLRNLLGAGVAWVLSVENGLSAGASWFLAVLCSPALHHTPWGGLGHRCESDTISALTKAPV